jgi:hypothetical protein
MARVQLADKAAIIASELAELCRLEDYATLRLLFDMVRVETELADGSGGEAVSIDRQIGGAPRDLPRSAPRQGVSQPVSRVL